MSGQILRDRPFTLHPSPIPFSPFPFLLPLLDISTLATPVFVNLRTTHRNSPQSDHQRLSHSQFPPFRHDPSWSI